MNKISVLVFILCLFMVTNVNAQTQDEFQIDVISTVTGTFNGGDHESTWDIDTDYYNVSEVTGSPAFDIYFNISDVNQSCSCANFSLLADYNGNAGHVVNLELKNESSQDWNTIIKVNHSVDQFDWFNGSIDDLTPYVNDSTNKIEGRIIHTSPGNVNDILNVNYLRFFTATSTSTTSTTTTIGDFCIGDLDCDSDKFCNLSTSECVDKFPADDSCSRNAMCLSGWCNASVCIPSTFVYSEYINDPPTTDFNGVGDPANIVDATLDNDFGKIVWTESLNLTYGMDFDSACEFGNYFVSCDSGYAPQLDKPANITIKNTPFTVYNLDSVIILVDGVTCSDCTNKERTNDNIMFSVPGFSNYSVALSSNYSAVLSNFSFPNTVYQNQENACLSFVLKNTKGEFLENQDADVYITDTSTGIIIKRFNTLASSSQFYEDQNGNFISISDENNPLTNSIGLYTFCFDVDRVWANYNLNFTIHAVANGQTVSQTSWVDVPLRPDIESMEIQIKKYSGMYALIFFLMLGSVILIGWLLAKFYYWKKNRKSGAGVL